MIFQNADAPFLNSSEIWLNSIARSFKYNLARSYFSFNKINPLFLHFSCAICENTFKRHNSFVYSAERCTSCKASSTFVVDSIYPHNFFIPEGKWGILCNGCDTFMPNNWDGIFCNFCRRCSFSYRRFPSGEGFV
jgi:hypothetical protein